MHTQTVSGKSVTNARIFGRLPQRVRHVDLERERGRGRIRIVQQPRPANDYMVGVRIRDPQAGSSHYEFTLAW
jgi:hypothetical protein